MEKQKTEKIMNVDLKIHKDATDEEWQRYNTVIPLITSKLLEKNIGDWCGRETAMKESKDVIFIRTNFWFVLENCIDEAKRQINKIIKNFNLSDFVVLRIGEPMDTSANYKTKIKNKRELKWIWKINK